MQTHNTYDQILKCFNENGVSLRDFLTEKYALCFDLRPSTDSSLHGNGATLDKKGVTLTIHRIAGTGNGKLNLHVFVFQDMLLNFKDGKFNSING